MLGETVMRILLVCATAAALVACSQEPAPAPESTEAAAVPAEPAAPATGSMAADGKSPVGMFKITTSKGEVLMDEVRADGTYSTTKDGKVVETGKWEQKAPDTYCYTSDEAGSKQECNTEGVDAAGVWTSVNAKGEKATVERVEG